MINIYLTNTNETEKEDKTTMNKRIYYYICQEKIERVRKRRVTHKKWAYSLAKKATVIECYERE